MALALYSLYSRLFRPGTGAALPLSGDLSRNRNSRRVSSGQSASRETLPLLQTFLHLCCGKAVHRGIPFNQPGKLEYPFLHALEERRVIRDGQIIEFGAQNVRWLPFQGEAEPLLRVPFSRLDRGIPIDDALAVERFIGRTEEFRIGGDEEPRVLRLELLDRHAGEELPGTSE